ncbi:DUF6452 family protein [Chitinophagaceae bacterium MMS25-I14]
MINKDRNVLLVLLVLFAICWGACETERDPCLTPVNVYVRAGTYRISDTNNIVLDTLLVNPVLGSVDSSDTVFLAGHSVNKFSGITLSPHADSCRWFLQPDSLYPQRRDTLTFYYQRQLKFISNACGYTYYFNISSVKSTVHAFADSTHAIDSVVLNNGSINGNANIENLKIYIHKHS